MKIGDNAKDFADTRNHWAKDAIDFVSARELVNGMNDSIYAPNNSTTRAQLWTILARQNDADLNGGNTWYEKAQLWSKDKGVSDGANPTGPQASPRRAVRRTSPTSPLTATTQTPCPGPWKAASPPVSATVASTPPPPAQEHRSQPSSGGPWLSKSSNCPEKE